MRASARESGPSPCLAAGAISPPLLCGSGFRVEPSRALDLKQNSSSAAGVVAHSSPEFGRRPGPAGALRARDPARFRGKSRARPLARRELGPAGVVSSQRRWKRPGSGGTLKRVARPSVDVCPSWETDNMDPSDKRKSEFRKMRSAFESLDWPVPTPQSFHHWTLARQVDHLVTAREAEPDLGFMARMLALCSLPRTNPGRRRQYKRVNGPYTLIMSATGTVRLPYGNLPRLATRLGQHGLRADPAAGANPGPQSLRVHARRRHLQR